MSDEVKHPHQTLPYPDHPLPSRQLACEKYRHDPAEQMIISGSLATSARYRRVTQGVVSMKWHRQVILCMSSTLYMYIYMYLFVYTYIYIHIYATWVYFGIIRDTVQHNFLINIYIYMIIYAYL